MKLVEILARELKEWPDGAVAIVQDNDRTVKWTESTIEPRRSYGGVWMRDDGEGKYIREIRNKSDDHATAIVTREMWQAERDSLERSKLEGKVKAPKANKDGWIRHRGGKCPVEAGTLIDVRWRDRTLHSGRPSNHWAWYHTKDDDDIMYWRPHVATTEQSSEVTIVSDALCDAIESATPLAENKAAQALLNRKSGFADAAQPADDLRAIRDRIHAIDAEQKAADEAHKAASEARTSERAELVQKLAGEGLALLGKADAEPAEDMSDQSKWREGDRLEIIDSTNPGWAQHKGKIGTLNKDYVGDRYIKFDCGGIWYLSDNTEVKWHSRPTA